MKNNKGFELTEIVIIIAIVSLLATIAVPNFIAAKESARLGISIEEYRETQRNSVAKKPERKAWKKTNRVPQSEFSTFYGRRR